MVDTKFSQFEYQFRGLGKTWSMFFWILFTYCDTFWIFSFSGDTDKIVSVPTLKNRFCTLFRGDNVSFPL